MSMSSAKEEQSAADPGQGGTWWQQQPKEKKFHDSGRTARLERAKEAHSLHDKQAMPEGMQQALPEELKEISNILKSFYAWMAKGKSAKSAPGYTSIVKNLFREQNLCLASLNSPEYGAFVKGSKENCKANGIFSAAVRQFQMWLKDRGSLEGPWEEKASLSDKLFDLRYSGGRKPQAPVDSDKPVGQAFKDIFGGPKAAEQAATGKAADEGATPTKGGKCSEAEQTPQKVLAGKAPAKRISSKLQGKGGAVAAATVAASTPAAETGRAAKKLKTSAPAGSKQEPENSAEADAAGQVQKKRSRKRSSAAAEQSAATSTEIGGTPAPDGAAQPRKRPARPRGAAAKAAAKAAKAKEQAPNSAASSAPAATPKEPSLKKAAKAAARVAAATKAAAAQEKAKAEDEKGDAKKGSVDKKVLGRQQQLSDLMKTARAHIQKRDFQRAEQVVKLVTEFCERVSIERPATLQDPAKLKEEAAAKANEDVAAGADDAPKGDELEVAQDACRRCFGLRRPGKDEPEDDSEVVPVPRKGKGKGGPKREAGAAGAAAAEDAEVGGEADDSAAKFAAIPEAVPEDYPKLHAVAAAFKAHLLANKVEQAAAEDTQKAFLELFQLDDKSFDGMATKAYVELASVEDKRHGEAASAFAAFWKAQSGKDLPQPPARLPTSEERNLAAESGVPPSWRVQVFHRVKRDDLVVLTAPDDTHEFTTKAGLKSMAVLDETFAAEKKKAEEAGLAEEAAKKTAAASLARRRHYAEERLRFQAEGAKERAAACQRFEQFFSCICSGSAQDGVALNGSLPVDCLGCYTRLEELFQGRPAYERLSSQGVQRTFFFHSQGRWVVAGALDAGAQPYAYVEDGAQAPHEVDREDGPPWMVPASASEGKDFEEVQGAPVWCAHLPNEELLRRAFKVLRLRRECCPGCGVHPAGEQAQDDAEDLDGKVQRLAWQSYDDVPDATPEERATYPTILKKFHAEGYPYLTGVRKLMARYRKSSAAMATKEFHQLVRNDPMNAVCNGFDSSAVLYFIMFWEKWGSSNFEPFQKKSDMEIGLMESKERSVYLRDVHRYDVDGRDAYEIKEQGSVLPDLQIDIPLTRLIADVTASWKQDLREFLSPQGFLQDDADASGLRAAKVGADLLPEPTEEEWASWSGVLKAFDGWKVGGKGGGKVRTCSKHTEPLQQMIQLHGKAPAVMASERYATLIIQEFWKDSAAAEAVTAFGEFWKEKQGTKMPDPSKGLLFGAQLPARWQVLPLAKVAATLNARRALRLPATWDLQLEPAFRATEPSEEGGRVFEDEASLREELQKQLEARQNEQRKKNAVAQEWKLPPRYEVEFEEDGTPYVLSPDGDVRYDSPEDVPRPAWMLDGGNSSKTSTKDKGKGSKGGGKGVGKGNSIDRDMTLAAMRFDFAEVWRLQMLKQQQLAQPKQAAKKETASTAGAPQTEEPEAETAADSEAAEKSQAPGADVLMPDASAAASAAKAKVTCEARCRAGKMPIVKKTEGAPLEENKARKYTKQVGLKQQQENQIQTGELMLKAHCWRVVGVRHQDGSILPLEKCKERRPGRVTCVLAQIAEEINKAEQERIRKQWGLDESWQVMIRTRLTGSQVTVVNPEGRHFFKRTQIAASRQSDEKKQRLIQEAASHQELLSILRGASAQCVFQVRGAAGAAEELNGVYRQCLEALPEIRFTKCCKALAAMSKPVEVHLVNSQWRFAAEGGGVLAITDAAARPFAGAVLRAPLGRMQLGCEVQLLQPDQAVAQVLECASTVALSRSCRICTGDRKAVKQSDLTSSTSRREQQEAFEARLRELAGRRQDAPRKLGDMAQHMVNKLLGARPEVAETLRNFFRRAGSGRGGGIRLGTLCSGTDSPAIALKHLAAALGAGLPGAEAADFRFEHVFSCEFDEAKQGFLLNNFEMDHLFSDCTQMGRRRAWDVKSKSIQELPGDIDFLVAGFSCKDLSFMNSYRKTLEEMGQSGRTLRGCFDYVERYRPRVVLLENVYAIDRADQHGLKQVNIVMEGLRARGYASGYTLMNSCDYYLPQIRHRIWMWGFRMDATLDPKETGETLRERSFATGTELNPKVQELLKLLEEPSALHFDDLLLPEEDPRLEEEKRQLYAKARRRQAKKASGEDTLTGRAASAKLTWQQKYTMHRAKLDYAQERPYTSERGARWKGLLNERTLELLDLKCLDVLNDQAMDPREVPMLWDLLQSVERVPGSRVRRDRQNYATCVLPPSLLWHTVRHRFILGQEKLALQGIFEEDLRDISSFPQVLLSDLAGNAFTSSVCLACMLAAATVADEAVAAPRAGGARAPLPSPQRALAAPPAGGDGEADSGEKSKKRRRKA